jgi:hypothetical protein
MNQMRHLAADFDPTVVAAIDARLQSVAADHHARILLAVESGSRAWGFPSPDSDFDCRFIYVRSPEEYLSLFPPRDVIEFPPDPLLDVNGWTWARPSGSFSRAMQLSSNGSLHRLFMRAISHFAWMHSRWRDKSRSPPP